LRDFLDEAEQFTGAGLVETGFLFEAKDADGSKIRRAPRASELAVYSVLEADGDVALRGEVVNCRRLDLLMMRMRLELSGEVAVVQDEFAGLDLGAFVTGGRCGRCLNSEVRRLMPWTFVALFQQKLGEIGAVLSVDG